MSVTVLSPSSDRSSTGTWTNNGSGSGRYDRVSDDDDATYISKDGTIFDTGSLHFNVDDITIDETYQRVKRVRLVMRAYSANFFGSYGSAWIADAGSPDVKYEDSELVADAYGGNGGIYWYWGPWLSTDGDGNFWEETALDNLAIIFEANGGTRLYEVFVEVEVVQEPSARIKDPSFTGDVCGVLNDFRWDFRSGETAATAAVWEPLPSQKKYEAKVFTKAVAEGGGFNANTSSAVAESGEVRSSKTFHNFATKSGGVVTSPISPEGEYYLYVRVAKDYWGQDWWSDWVGKEFLAASDPVVAYDSPSFEETITTTARPTLEWTYTHDNNSPQAKADVRVYKKPEAGWEWDLVFGEYIDLDAIDQEPIWSTIIYGEDDSVEVDEDLRNGEYRWCLKVTDKDFGQSTLWYDFPFFLDADGPDAPTLSAVTDDDNAKVELSFTWTKGAGSIYPDGYIIERQVDGGEWEPVTDGSVPLLSTAIELPGTYAHRLVTPNTSGGLGTHATKVRCVTKIALDDWTPASSQALAGRYHTSVATSSWRLYVSTDGKLNFHWIETDGVTQRTATSSVTTGFTNGTPYWVRVDAHVTDNPYTVEFWTSEDGVNWTQLGSTVTGAVASSFKDNTGSGNVEFGSVAGGTGMLALGDFFFGYIEDISGVTPVRLLQLDGAGQTLGSTTWTDEIQNGVIYPARTWTGYGNVDPYYLGEDIFDYEAPFNVPLKYRAVVFGESGGERRVSDPSSEESEQHDIDVCWLKSLDDPSLNRHVVIADKWSRRTRAKSRSEHNALGRTKPLVMKGSSEGRKFSLTFTLRGETEVGELEELLESGSTLLFQTPKESMYVEVAGDYDISDHLWDHLRGDEWLQQMTVPFVEVSH